MTSLEIARRYYQCFNERRFDEAGELVDPQATFHYVPTKQRLIGRAGYRALVAAWVIAFEDASLDVIDLQVLDAGTVRAEFVGRGTHTGDLVLGEYFTLPATGTHADLPFRDTLSIRNGLIVASKLEFDVAELRRRLTQAVTFGMFGGKS